MHKLCWLVALPWLVAPGWASGCPDRMQREALLSRAQSAERGDPEPWTAVLDAARDCRDPSTELIALGQRAQAAIVAGDMLRARADLTELVARAHQSGEARIEADGRRRLADLMIAAAEMEPARAELQRALNLAMAAFDRPLAAQVQSTLSRLERRVGNYVEALRHEQQSLRLRRLVDPPFEVWESLQNLAVLYEQIELYDESRRHYAEALAEAELRGGPRDVLDALVGFAGFLNDFGAAEAPLALGYAERALALAEEFGEPLRRGSSWLQVGRANTALGRYDQAELAFARALEIAEQTAGRALEAHVRYRRGELYMLRGDWTAAQSDIERAHAIYAQQANRHRLAKVYGTLEVLYGRLGDELAAARAGREHYRLRNELLGAGASGKLGEILSDFALSEERHRNALLERENEVAALRLEHERAQRRYAWLAAVLLALLIGLLAWRFRQTQRLYANLRKQQSALERAHAELSARSEALYQATVTDSLTGLYNRAYAIEHLREVLERYAEHGWRPAVLILDLDHFKQINDRHGHLVGDRVLQAASAALREGLGEHDLIARLGGEEFVVVLRDVDRTSAQVQAELLRKRVADLSVQTDTAVLKLTVSIGVCWVRDLAAPTVTGVLRAADLAMYQAKSEGRNAVRLAPAGA